MSLFPAHVSTNELRARRQRLFDGMQNLNWSPLDSNASAWIAGSFMDDRGQTRALACVGRTNSLGQIDLRCDEQLLHAVLGEAMRLGFGQLDVFGEFEGPTPGSLLNRGVRCCGMSDFEQALFKTLPTQENPDWARDRRLFSAALGKIVPGSDATPDMDAHEEALMRLLATVPKHPGANPQHRNHRGPWVNTRPAVDEGLALQVISTLGHPHLASVDMDDKAQRDAAALRAQLLREALRNQPASVRQGLVRALLNSPAYASRKLDLAEAAGEAINGSIEQIAERVLASAQAEELLPTLLVVNAGTEGLPGQLVATAFGAQQWQAGIDLLEAGLKPGPFGASAAEAVLQHNGWPATMHILLSSGLDPDARVPGLGVSLLEAAHRLGRPALAQILILGGADRKATWSDGTCGADFYAQAQLPDPDENVDHGMRQKQKDWARRAGRPFFSPGVVVLPRNPHLDRGVEPE